MQQCAGVGKLVAHPWWHDGVAASDGKPREHVRECPTVAFQLFEDLLRMCCAGVVLEQRSDRLAGFRYSGARMAANIPEEGIATACSVIRGSQPMPGENQLR